MAIFPGHRLLVARRTTSGPEWAVVGGPNDRSVRAWWSYPVCVLAFAPAVIVDVVTFPIVLLLGTQH
jgi:hypothetical protein